MGRTSEVRNSQAVLSTQNPKVRTQNFPMTFRREFWTYLIVTAVTVLIWFWAAGETRDSKPLTVRVQFAVDDAASWVINPRQQVVSVTVEGSQLALQRAEEQMREAIRHQLTPSTGATTVDLMAVLREHPIIAETGVRILTAEPNTIELRMDEIVRVPARVRPHLPRVQTVGDIEVDPPEVTVSMTRTLRQQLPAELLVEPQIDPDRLVGLEPDVMHTIEAPLRLPDAVLAGTDVTIRPSTASFTFVVRSRIGEHTLDSVRVQVGGPPEDSREYVVDVEPTVLRNVTVRADAELISRIAAQEITVVAMVHLSSREKEQRIDRKRVSYFLAIVPTADGGTRGQLIEADVEGAGQPPLVNLDIQRKEVP